ncbi:MAG: zinc ribbon domain-containing protein [Actinobacteria bacterium]|nr:MAG: zinc ribbon domain-containing protein [Actinomycetota bacterium]
MDLFGYINDIVAFFQRPIWRNLIYGFVYGFIFILIVVWLAFVYWTYRDSKLRSESVVSAVFWALVVLVLNFLGLIIYLILRPPEFIDDVIERDLEIERMQTLLDSKQSNCPACRSLIKDDFLICPYCRKKLRNSCINCGKPLSLNWKVCPYCRTTQ